MKVCANGKACVFALRDCPDVTSHMNMGWWTPTDIFTDSESVQCKVYTTIKYNILIKFIKNKNKIN
jgi:hypothetical protein